MLRDAMLDVLCAVPHYEIDGSPWMDKRDEGIRQIEEQLRAFIIKEPFASLWETRLAVKSGGRKSKYGPIPWVRLHSPVYSPTAGKGFYLVYLFSADGSAVYLSINQGTSQPGTTRPINGGAELRNKSAEARHIIQEWRLKSTLSGASINMDLHGKKRDSLSSYSRKRMRNYEDANVLALRYDASNLPKDDVLLRDLSSMLPLLWRLYDHSFPEDLPIPTEQEVDTAGQLGSTKAQGRQMDPVKRKAIEVYAEDKMQRWLEHNGWAVERVGAFRLGYDLLCKRGGQELHVEVKGTQTLGEEVILTRGEVDHASNGKCSADHALVVCSSIVVRYLDDEPQCSQGNVLILNPWHPAGESLKPQEYSYLVPHHEGVSI